MKRQFKKTMVPLCVLLASACGSADKTGTSGGGNDVHGDDMADQSDSGDSCLSQRCSAEINACGSECRSLLQCLDNCTTDSCSKGCVNAAPSYAADQLVALLECYDAKCKAPSGSGSSGSSSGGTSTESGSTGGKSTTEINQCINGIAVMCGCASAADSPCTSSEKDNAYNGCVAGGAYKMFDYFYCLGDQKPGSLSGCVSAFEYCDSYLPN